MQWGKKERPNLVNSHERQVYFRALSIFAMAKKDLWYESMPRYFSFHMQSSNNNEKSLRRLQTTLTTVIVNHLSVFTEVLIIITIFPPNKFKILPSTHIDYIFCARKTNLTATCLATNSMFLWLLFTAFRPLRRQLTRNHCSCCSSQEQFGFASNRSDESKLKHW